MLNKSFIALSITGLFVSLVGAAETTTPSKGNAGNTGTQPQKIEVKIDSTNVRPTMTNVSEDAKSDENDRIMREVQYKLKMSHKNYSINIHVLDGVVTLTGTVPSSQDKNNIEMDIKNIPGVKKVVNNLESKNAVPKVDAKY